MEKIKIRSFSVPAYVHRTVVVGSGSAGLNCADLLAAGGEDTALVTEGMNMGTSRNTGSDKQTYYKLTVSGSAPDSVYSLAESLHGGGAMHGDIALTEAASSTHAFFRLVELGVPFPQNQYGEYIGYKTDHDLGGGRATSCGPLTSRYMTEALERSLRKKNIPIYDGFRVIEIFTETENGAAVGLLALGGAISKDNPLGLAAFLCRNIVYAVGGPSTIYSSTVYPESQTCAHGTAFRAGAEGVNLTESQYGIAAVGFRWNISGSYQQVIPRYISVEGGGEAREFYKGSFDNIFLKGYQWPFDPAKISGSSSVDLAVYNERRAGRRVFLDFTRDPEGFSFDKLGSEARTYLKNSGSEQDAPVKRLRAMNEPAYRLFLSHGIDLEREPLEIDVCAQHNNGGLACDIWYETNIKRLYAAGEVCGVFGVSRPGGSALNSTQVSSARAARKILSEKSAPFNAALPEGADSVLLDFYCGSDLSIGDIMDFRRSCGERMSGTGAFIRDGTEVKAALEKTKEELRNYSQCSSDPALFREITINYDILVTQYLYLSAIDGDIADGGTSRGSYLIAGRPEIDVSHRDKLCYAKLSAPGGTALPEVVLRWEKARELPRSEQWFEKVYGASFK